jgi:hypothetical protein
MQTTATLNPILTGHLANVPLLSPRAPGAPYRRMQTKIASDSYNCEDYGLEAPAPDEERKKYGAYFDLDVLKTRRLVDTIRVNREIRAKNLITGASVPSANVAVVWDNPASNPKHDVDVARNIIRQQAGVLPNVLMLPWTIKTVLETHPLLADRFKFTTPGTTTEIQMAQYFGVNKVVVASNILATNNEGETFSPADIWGNVAVLGYINDVPDLEVPSFGRTFFWTAFTSEVTEDTGGTGPAMTQGGAGPELMQIFTYRDETVKSDIHRGEHYVTEKLVAPQAAYVLNNVL